MRFKSAQIRANQQIRDQLRDIWWRASGDKQPGAKTLQVAGGEDGHRVKLSLFRTSTELNPNTLVSAKDHSGSVGPGAAFHSSLRHEFP